MDSFNDFVRSSSLRTNLNDLLIKSPVELLGVSSTAADALKKVGIITIFDLGTSNLFATANNIISMKTASVDLGLISEDYFKDPKLIAKPEDINDQSLNNLRILSDADANNLKSALDISTVWDLANWPPYVAAMKITSESFGSTVDPEDLQSEVLRPMMGQYPTECVYYPTLVMFQTLGEPVKTVDLDSAISINALTNAKYKIKPAIGALLTYSQSWYSKGITLGHMLHSLALAPGEATRVAVIDWSRKSRASETESISEAEGLDSSAYHGRAVSEVQNAVANDYQAGGSFASSNASSSSSSVAESAGTGFLSSLFVSADESGTYQNASTTTTAQSSSWSVGSRSASANMQQNVNDLTEQHSSAVRNRRASVVKEVSQSEHEQVSTRIVANYNHMHALTIQYYEVVQIYLCLAKLHSAVRVLFIPFDIIDFSTPDAWKLIERFRMVLVRASLNRRIYSLLLDDITSVQIKPVLPAKFGFRPVMTLESVASRIFRKVGGLATPAPSQPAAAAAQPAAEKISWDSEAIKNISQTLKMNIIKPDSDNVYLPPETTLHSLRLYRVEGTNLKIQIECVGNEFINQSVSQDDMSVELETPIQLSKIKTIRITGTFPSAGKGLLYFVLSNSGREFPLPVNISVAVSAAWQDLVNIINDQSDRRKEIQEHLQAYSEYYTRAIFRSLDSTSLSMILSQYDLNDKPLNMVVEPRPINMIGNYLIFRAPVDDETDPNDSALLVDGKKISWAEYLKYKNILHATDSRLIPIPTGGVFAEAVLGRSNSAEKLDITRFWNWQDSPIPLSPPEIAPVDTGSRATPEDVKPGQLSQPILNLLNPTTLPAPDSMSTILTALATMNFRDMSGLADVIKLAGTTSSGTLTAATEAGKLASENMKTEAQKEVQMGQTAADIAKSVISAYTGGAAGGAGGKSPSVAGAMINQGKNMDSRGVQNPVTDSKGNQSASKSKELSYTDQNALGTASSEIDNITKSLTDQITKSVLSSIVP